MCAHALFPLEALTIVPWLLPCSRPRLVPTKAQPSVLLIYTKLQAHILNFLISLDQHTYQFSFVETRTANTMADICNLLVLK